MSEIVYRLESGGKFVDFKCSGKDALLGAVVSAALCLWDELHPGEMGEHIEELRRGFEQAAEMERERALAT